MITNEELNAFLDANKEIIENSTNARTYDVAVVFHELFKNKYVCGKLKKRMWFVFNGIRWKTTETGPYLDISSDFVRLYELYAARLKEQLSFEGVDAHHLPPQPLTATTATTAAAASHKELTSALGKGGIDTLRRKCEDLRTSNEVVECIRYLSANLPKSISQSTTSQAIVLHSIEELWKRYDLLNALEKVPEEQREQLIVRQKLAAVENLIDMLKNVTFKDLLCRECCHLFYCENFIKQLDKNEHIIPFLNGVLDTTTNEFRKGKQDDYAFLHIHCEYDGSMDKVADFLKLHKDIMKRRKRSQQHERNICS
jgi:hypothetical protein